MNTAPLYSETDEFEAMPEADREYPVIITVTEKYLVWADGDDAADAVRNVEACETDYLEGVRPFMADVTDIDEAHPWEVEDARIEHGGDRRFGPWRPGEPRRLLPRSDADRLYIERHIAEEMARDLPTREQVTA